MRRPVLPALAALATLALAGCGSDAPPDSKAEWTAAVKAAGFTPHAPHSYDEMFESAKNFCAAGSALAIAGLARTVLDPAQATEVAMPAPGQDPDKAATVYGDATWKWACNHSG
ncbi:hypothetical protein [Amycolatopsis vancoresmycina]|uniref:DUF732 domain-containing protein n=1 Tax=Amycolatopsis vancoresmycina DSM 44592 TaxID=1292037 RepID=R1HDN8_9PSEU|nr:hypothetical protein [Amycolatopsis vancoresmycina]EOD58516.1 hypothetical protein H480_43290 [Amycolatopsis vancoresmycina DSM 44592]